MADVYVLQCNTLYIPYFHKPKCCMLEVRDQAFIFPTCMYLSPLPPPPPQGIFSDYTDVSL